MLGLGINCYYLGINGSARSRSRSTYLGILFPEICTSRDLGPGRETRASGKDSALFTSLWQTLHGTAILVVTMIASSNKCIASSNKCLTGSNKKLLELYCHIYMPTLTPLAPPLAVSRQSGLAVPWSVVSGLGRLGPHEGPVGQSQSAPTNTPV